MRTKILKAKIKTFDPFTVDLRWGCVCEFETQVEGAQDKAELVCSDCGRKYTFTLEHFADKPVQMKLIPVEPEVKDEVPAPSGEEPKLCPIMMQAVVFQKATEMTKIDKIELNELARCKKEECAWYTKYKKLPMLEKTVIRDGMCGIKEIAGKIFTKSITFKGENE